MTSLIAAINADTATANKNMRARMDRLNTLTAEKVRYMLRHVVCVVSESGDNIEIAAHGGTFVMNTDGGLEHVPGTVEENPGLAYMFGILQGIEMMLEMNRYAI